MSKQPMLVLSYAGKRYDYFNTNIRVSWEVAEEKALEEALNLPFKDLYKLEEHFTRFLDSCTEQYQIELDYAPYTTLIWASV